MLSVSVLYFSYSYDISSQTDVTTGVIAGVTDAMTDATIGATIGGPTAAMTDETTDATIGEIGIETETWNKIEPGGEHHLSF